MDVTRGSLLFGLLATAGCIETTTPTEPGPVPVPAVDVTTLRCAAPPACAATDAATVDSYPSASDLEARLVGAWWSCAAPTLFGRGIELTPDRQVFELAAATDGSGACARTGPAIAAWSVLDISEQNPPGTYQLEFHWADGRWSVIIPTFTTDVRRLDDEVNAWRFARLQRPVAP
ncbi:MAG: hypothetical protein IPH44_22115 [Myxococcales bacterium]|nr:hypothetical protein [Myxococcales bacterium]MBK7192059.1 hypothetical protein [Myxococcales bacterium]MBP6846274.1 hypothetical protein [Kofleriaceae bacterium]